MQASNLGCFDGSSDRFRLGAGLLSLLSSPFGPSRVALCGSSLWDPKKRLTRTSSVKGSRRKKVAKEVD